MVPPCWRAKVALGQDKQKTYIILDGNFLCLSCPSATFALQHGGFVPREWLAAKDLFIVTRDNVGRHQSAMGRIVTKGRSIDWWMNIKRYEKIN